MSSREHEHSSVRHYVIVYVGLVVLTTLTFLLGKVHLGPWNVVVALVIASAKGTLVVLFFMHLLEHKGASRLVMATTTVFVAVLILFTMSDVAFRFPITNPPGSASAKPAR